MFRDAALLHSCNHSKALFGTAKIGAVFVPIHFRFVACEVGQLLDACGRKVLIVGSGFAEGGIADEYDRPLPAGKDAEILVRGPFVCRGARNRPQWMGGRVSNSRWRSFQWVDVLPR